MPSGINPLPILTVRAAFASTPLDTSPTWTDITQYVKSIAITRGRQHILSVFEPGRLTLECYGADRQLDPLNTDLTNPPDMNQQIQVLATWNHMTVASAGDTITAGWADLANAAVTFPAGVLQLVANAGGDMSAATGTGLSGFAVVGGQTYTGMIGVKAATIARSVNLSIYWYDAAGAQISVSTGADVADVTNGYTVVTVVGIAPVRAVYGALALQVKNAVTVYETHTAIQPGVFPASGVTVWHPGGLVPLFTGFIDGIRPLWKGNLSTDIEITATDGQRMLAQITAASQIILTVAAALTADSATTYYLLTNPPVASGSGSGRMHPMHIVAGVGSYGGMGVTAGPNASYTADTFNGTTDYLGCPSAAFLVNQNFWAGPFSVEIWFQLSAAPATTRYMWAIAGGTTEYMHLGMDSAGHLQYTAYKSPSNQLTISATAASYADGNWHQAVVTCAADGKTTKLYIDSVLVGSGVATAAHTVAATRAFMGADVVLGNTSIAANFWPGALSIAAFYATTALTAASIADHYNIALTGSKQQLSGARIAAILASISWPSAWTNIGTGDTVVIANTPSGTQTVLGYLQTIEQTERGYLFADSAGLITFLARSGIYEAPRNVLQGTFGDTAGAVPFLTSPGFTRDIVDLYNVSVVGRVNGADQTVADDTSIARYGVELTLNQTGLLFTTDAESLTRAQANVAQFSNPSTRVDKIDVNPFAAPAVAYDAVIYRELTDRVEVNRNPYSTANGFGAPTFSQMQMIEGIAHAIDLTQRRWTTTYALSPYDVNGVWILQDPIRGVLGVTTIPWQ